MKKKIIGSVIALALAFGAVAVLPGVTGGKADIAVTASAASGGFVIKTDEYGAKYVESYKGKGGDITIPKGVTYIGEAAFKGNTNITSIVFPEGTVKYGIGYEAFAFCSKLKKITVNGDCAFIGDNAFNSCGKLETVIIKGDLSDEDENCGIGEDAFSSCALLKTVTFTKKDAVVDSLRVRAFFNCPSLESINLPSGLKEINRETFLNCPKLTSLTIPKDTVINGTNPMGTICGADTSEEVWNLILGNAPSMTVTTYISDGNNAVYLDIPIADPKDCSKLDECSYSEDVTCDGNPEMIASVCRIKGETLTLTVTKGSNAEKWAKKNKIKYVYAETGSSVSDKLSAPANIKAAAGSGKITLKWDAVDGAKAYRVFKYNPSTKKYEKYKDVSKTTCTVSGLKKGTKYQFKVAALDKVNGKYVAGTSSKEVSAAAK